MAALLEVLLRIARPRRARKLLPHLRAFGRPAERARTPPAPPRSGTGLYTTNGGPNDASDPSFPASPPTGGGGPVPGRHRGGGGGARLEGKAPAGAGVRHRRDGARGPGQRLEEARGRPQPRGA